MHQIFLTLLATISSLAATKGHLNYENFKENPVIFEDSKLGMGSQIPEGREKIEELGFVININGMVTPMEVNEMKTRCSFDIVNARKFTRLKFEPGQNQFNQSFPFNLDEMSRSDFNVNTRTIIMVPGYRSKQEETWIKSARDYWLKLIPDADVIQVSWADSNRGLYNKAVAQTPLVARQITIFLHYLATLSGTSLADDNFVSKIHMIGHSLGAHIAGFVGQDLSGRLGRITALDPAGPSFDQFGRNERLDTSDARLVEVIHTNVGKMKYFKMAVTAPFEALYLYLPGLSGLGKKMGDSYNGEGDTAWFGIDKHIGHVDYYANNGRVQPGCSGLIHICDHKRAHGIYVDLLKHSVELRNEFGNLKDQNQQRLLKSSRILAYKAETYDSFISGGAFLENCNNLFRFADEEQKLSDFEYMRAFNTCTVPIDLVSPVGELIDEFKQYRGIDMVRDTSSNSKFFFATLDESELVGDHWLIKLHIDHGKSEWVDESCALMAEVEMTKRRDKTTRELTIDANKLKSLIEKKQPIGLPYAHADGVRNRVVLVKLFETIAGKQAHNDVEYSTGAFAELAREVMPEKISLSLIKPKTPSFLNTFKNATLKLIKFDTASTKCTLFIDRVEVLSMSIPQTGNMMLTGVFRSRLEEHSEELMISSHEEYKSDRHPLKRSISAELSTISQPNIVLDLHGVVPGK